MESLRIVLLTNSNARKVQESDEQIRDLLSNLQVSIVNKDNYEPKDFETAISRHAKEINGVVVGGGDGSMNAVVPSLLKYNLPLGILPMGTSNNLSRNLGISSKLEEACKIISERKTKAIDLGKVNGFYFLNVAGMGISNTVNRNVPNVLKKYLGMVAYMVTALNVFKNYKRFRADIKTPEASLCVRSVQISVCNGQFFASGVKIAPDAAIDDGVLDLCSIHVRSWFEIPKVISDFKKGIVKEEHSALLKQSREFTITTSRPILIDTDGEIRSQTPAKFEIVPKAINVFAP